MVAVVIGTSESLSMERNGLECVDNCDAKGAILSFGNGSILVHIPYLRGLVTLKGIRSLQDLNEVANRLQMYCDFVVNI